MSEIISDERHGLATLFLTTATARETAAEADTDLRYAVAADSIRQIAATLDQVPDDTLLRLATINTACDGLMARVITDRLLALGFELQPCDDALAFFAPIERAVEAMLAKGRLH